MSVKRTVLRDLSYPIVNKCILNETQPIKFIRSLIILYTFLHVPIYVYDVLNT